MSSGCKRLIVFSDVHVPYHSEVGVELLRKTIRYLRPHIAVCAGDFVDYYAVSRFSKDPRRKALLVDEVREGLEVLKKINRTLDSHGTAERYFIAGNHEHRLSRYVQDKAPALVGMPGLDIPDLLQLKKHGWKYTKYMDSMRLGKIIYTHDLGSAGRYAPFRAVDAMHHSAVIGHTHRIGYVVEGDATGKSKVGISFGHLSDVSKADYAHQAKLRRNWALGFGVGYLQPDGTTFFQPCPVVNNSVCVEGKVIKA